MSSKSDDVIRKVERGARVAKIREALEATGDEFAEMLQALAQQLGLKNRYDKYKVSRLESGGRKVTAEEVAILTLLDPEERDATWLLFGDKRAKRVDPKIVRPAKGTAKAKQDVG